MLITQIFSVFPDKKRKRKAASGPHTAKCTLCPCGASRTACLTKYDDVVPFHGIHCKAHSPAPWAFARFALDGVVLELFLRSRRFWVHDSPCLQYLWRTARSGLSSSMDPPSSRASGNALGFYPPGINSQRNCKVHPPAVPACAGQALASAFRASENIDGRNRTGGTVIFSSQICRP